MVHAIVPVRRSRPDWWHYALLGLALLQATFFLIPQTRPGRLGVVCWLFGADLILWPGLAGLLLLGAVLTSAWRRPFWNRWRAAGYLGLVGLAASPLAFRTYPSSYDNAPSLVRFRLPLDGPVTVGWGGATPDVNYHVIAPDQRWAYDLAVSKDGKTYQGSGEHCEDCYAYGLPVVAPADGTVEDTRDGDPDMPIGVLGGGRDAGGNQVVLRVAPGEYLFLCHLQPGTLAVKKGDAVKAGQVVGRVGNSGNTSEPHVHIHLQDCAGGVFAEGIPLYFHDYRVEGRLVDRGMPTGGIEGETLVGQIVEHAGSAAARARDSVP
jgi:murein DD-endopeptidase MepM/ murein hydrolase activator NlpD